MPDPLALQVHIVGVLNESQESPHGAILLGSPEATRAAAMLLYQDVRLVPEALFDEVECRLQKDASRKDIREALAIVRRMRGIA